MNEPSCAKMQEPRRSDVPYQRTNLEDFARMLRKNYTPEEIRAALQCMVDS